MKKIIKDNMKLILIVLSGFVIYFPSIFSFYTNDDFFHFVVSKANNFKDFLNFFNLAAPVSGFPNYRPLATQVFYFLDWKFFNLNPIPMHILLLILFAAIITLVYEITILISNKKNLGLTAAFLYAVSATHYGQLYFLATQEIIFGFFFFLAVWLFIKFITEEERKYLVFSFIGFVLALFCKEPAVTLPFILILVYLFFKVKKMTKISFKKIAHLLTPFFFILVGYLYLRFFHYGFAQGDSYLWSFSLPRALNSVFWYFLWSLNIPEMLVDFVGPGLKFLPNLFIYYSKEVIPILILFILQVVMVIYATVMTFKERTKSFVNILFFSLLWFVGSLVTVIFLPIHKFSFYLTVPLLGVVLALAYLLDERSKLFKFIFIGLYLVTSLMSLFLTKKTHWITRGEETAKRVYEYFLVNKDGYKGKKIVFVDTDRDKELPWSPTASLKTILSNNDFFAVFFPKEFTVIYEEDKQIPKADMIIKSRQFLGY